MADEAWEKRKLQRGLDLRPMFATHRLYNSLTEEKNPEMILEVTPQTIRYGSRVPYAEVLQKGSPEHGIRARPFIRFLPGDLERWSRTVSSYILEPMGRRRG